MEPKTNVLPIPYLDQVYLLVGWALGILSKSRARSGFGVHPPLFLLALVFLGYD